MAKLNFCSNGVPVNEQVVKYQMSRKSSDYAPVQKYYDNYKKQWFNQLVDYFDWETFDNEYDYKLFRAIESFSNSQSQSLAEEHGWSDLGRFNRWFFRILTNWKSNVKNSKFRVKKMPSSQCPVCGRMVPRIDQDHLWHYKTTADLPDYFVWNDRIYEVCLLPKAYLATWGRKTPEKMLALQRRDFKSIADEKDKVQWPWKIKSQLGVMCPFTKRIVPEINNEYIRSLPEKYSRYAPSTLWESFIEEYPHALIQSETYSLEHGYGDQSEEEDLADYVSADHRNVPNGIFLDYESICNGIIPHDLESVFMAIESAVSDDVDKLLLKMVASGHVVDDVAETLAVDKKEVRRRLRGMQSNDVLKRTLIS